MRWLWALAALVLTACSSGATPAPPLTVGPLTSTPSARPIVVSPAPSGSTVGPICRVDAAAEKGGGTVDPDPSEVTAAWLPGMNARPCRSIITHGTAAVARLLASDIRHLPPFPSAPMACPMADGTAVTLVFGYVTGHDEQAYLMLTGCAEVLGVGQMSDALRADLRPLAPPAWQQYLQR